MPVDNVEFGDFERDKEIQWQNVINKTFDSVRFYKMCELDEKNLLVLGGYFCAEMVCQGVLQNLKNKNDAHDFRIKSTNNDPNLAKIIVHQPEMVQKGKVVALVAVKEKIKGEGKEKTYEGSIAMLEYTKGFKDPIRIFYATK